MRSDLKQVIWLILTSYVMEGLCFDDVALVRVVEEAFVGVRVRLVPSERFVCH